jgi:hypothetical protein
VPAVEAFLELKTLLADLRSSDYCAIPSSLTAIGGDQLGIDVVLLVHVQRFGGDLIRHLTMRWFSLVKELLT